jgi:hypothetical protein
VVGATMVASSASAASPPDRKARLKQLLDLSNKIPAKAQKLLSSGTQNVLNVATWMNSPHPKGGDDGPTFTVGPQGLDTASGVKAQSKLKAQAAAHSAAVQAECDRDGLSRVSDPNLDFQTSVVAGMTQSETSSGWCGDTVVAGYNDSGAFLRTAGVDPFGAASFNGVSVSANGGRTFVDLGFLNPGTDPANFLLGDPVVACGSSRLFYYASIFQTATPPDANGNRNPLAAASVSVSTNGGLTWGAPNVAVAKDGFSHFIDKPWMTIDPANPTHVFVTYTDFDLSFSSVACPNDFRLAIELVQSFDGGASWSETPTVIDEECLFATGNSVQGSNVVVAGDGSVFVGYEFFPPTATNSINVSVSADGGKTFSAPTAIANGVVPNGGDGLLQSGFRNNEFPQLAVDRSNGRSKGTIYATWSDGRNNAIPDLFVSVGVYTYPDILVSKSTDGGATWSAPVAVSPMLDDFVGVGRDQFMPGIAVDRHGTVGVCFYDRSADPNNLVVDRHCATSSNGGASFRSRAVTTSHWVPLHSSDVLINPTYIGDYDALTTDATLQHDGFFGTFEVQHNDNPDVLGKKF